jgi:membrane dipeptidase
MTFIIDAHEDIAYNALSFGRDYTRSALKTRQLEADTQVPARAGQTLLGWPEYQRGQVALIVGTIFLSPRRYQAGSWDLQSYADPGEAARLIRGQFDYYGRLADAHPDKFFQVKTQADLAEILAPWTQAPVNEPPAAHRVGLLLSMEGAEGLRQPEDLEEYWNMGLRAVGPVWAGTRFCGGMYNPGGFTREGYQLLEVMGNLGYILDLAHMNEMSALQALDAYTGTVIASHVNARALLKDSRGERHFTDATIRRLAERGGVMGILPFNKFLLQGWSESNDRNLVTLEHVAAHIDHVCQLTGSVDHVALGTDFDGGFGWPAVPLEINTIADLPKLEPVLSQHGYTEAEIAAILHGNWQKVLESSLP